MNLLLGNKYAEQFLQYFIRQAGNGLVSKNLTSFYGIQLLAYTLLRVKRSPQKTLHIHASFTKEKF